MEGTGSAAEFLPPRLTLLALREAAQACRGCQLYENATQAVFGEGTRTAALMLVGEQPGDGRSLGAPLRRPAGKLLDRALEEAGIDRGKTYVTNAVKHFKWEARGKRRIHAKPSWSEIAACQPWLEAEGASPWTRPSLRYVTATIHPSAILRGEPADREREFAGLVGDLRKVADLI